MEKCPNCGQMMPKGGTCPNCGYKAGGGGSAPAKGPFGQELQKITQPKKPMPPKKKSRKRPPAGPPKSGY